MTEETPEQDDLRDLVEAYCDDVIDDEEVQRLEARLLQDPDARRVFTRAFHFHTELHFALRARRAADAVMERVFDASPSGGRARSWAAGPGRWLPASRSRLAAWTIAASLALLAVLATFRFLGTTRPGGPSVSEVRAQVRPGGNIAWLVNAQDCLWAESELEMPGRDMRAGKRLRLRRGLAEIEFDRGARVILQGPAGLELVSGTEVRLLDGTLTARVPLAARGFTVLSPRGKIVDLGTEFGLSVDEAGATTVRVFDGFVAVSPLAAGRAPQAAVTIARDQTARIEGQVVALKPAATETGADRFVRAIEPPPVLVPRMLHLDFTRPIPDTLEDALGRGTGLTHRLPGTGFEIPLRDPNVQLDVDAGTLKLTTTRSDINTQDRMATGEYLGFRLSELGFSGREDFEISATIPQIPALEVVGQFGLYVGGSSAANIRGGLISQPQPDRYGLFLVNNRGGTDSDLNEVGLMATGDDLRLTLRRIGGRYSLIVKNLTARSSNTLTIAHPAFLDPERDLYAGVFGANTQSNLSRTLTIKEVKVTVWIDQTRRPGVTVRPALHRTIR
jgi:hypothetical protein